MSKIANYLNEHILGEVLSDASTLESFSRDQSILSTKPDMVIFPRTTSDMRKVARFASQLAEKGHQLPLIMRGGATNTTGASSGKGAVIATKPYLSNVLELDAKQRLVRVQPGITFKALSDALSLHGLALPVSPSNNNLSTVGGAIANATTSAWSGKYGAITAWTKRLEVVLATGDVLQTGRVSRREVNRIKGTQNFIGEIYRQIDGLLEDNKELIDSQLKDTVTGNVGYPRIADVKQKDGSIDLTPLFVGSQGTLGIISEMIMGVDYISQQKEAVAASFEHFSEAQDALDVLRPLGPARLQLLDGALYETATAQGNKYPFAEPVAREGAVVVAWFDEYSERTRQKRVKKARKTLTQLKADVVDSVTTSRHQLEQISEVTATTNRLPDAAALPLVDGAYVPANRLDDFTKAITLLSRKLQLALPLHTRALDDLVYCRPAFDLKKVTDRQKALKFIDAYADIVHAHDGYLCGDGAEGRLLAAQGYAHLDSDIQELYKKVRDIFDPQGTLNPDVKRPHDAKALAKAVRSEYHNPVADQFSARSS